MGNWRRNRKYRRAGRRTGRYIRGHSDRSKNIQITGMNLTAIIAIISLAVMLGFLTTKFFVYPMIIGEEADFDTDFGKVISGYVQNRSEQRNEEETAKNPVTEPSGQETTIFDQAEVQKQPEKAAAKMNGYCIQYGSFSSRDSAQKLLDELEATGLTAQIIENEDSFKVIGQLFATKEEAVSARDSVLMYASPEYADVFVTSI